MIPTMTIEQQGLHVHFLSFFCIYNNLYDNDDGDSNDGVDDLFQERLMYFPTWIDLKGADAVPETVHHCVSSLLVFLHVCSLSVSHRNRPAQFAVYKETVLPSSLSIQKSS